MTTLVVADDHLVVRVGLKTLLSGGPGYKVIGEAIDGCAAVEAVRDLKPDVLILDLMMPASNGMEVIEEVKRIAPRTRIIVLTMHANESYVSEAFHKGADGYVVKDSLASELFDAIHTVMAGRRYLSERFSLSLGGKPLPQTGRGKTVKTSLTVREQEVLLQIAKGQANKEIATALSISIRTVETHRSKIMRKLGIKSHAGLIHYATRQNILSLP